MLSAMEKVHALALREFRLLTRSRTGMTRGLAIPIAGGFVCVWMTHAASPDPVYVMALFMVLSGIVLGTERGDNRVTQSVRAVAGRGIFVSAWVLSYTVILLTQITVLASIAAGIGGFHPSGAAMTLAVLSGLAASSIARHL